MTVDATMLTIRPLTGREELDLFCRLPYVLNDELGDDLDAGRRQPGWMWVAMDGNRLLARAAWWGLDAQEAPELLDIFDVDDRAGGDRVAIGERLLVSAMKEVFAAGGRPADYGRYLASDWREHCETRRAVEERMAAVAGTGAEFLVERLRLEWRQGTPMPAATGRLRFRPICSNDELIALMVAALDGTLDAHDRRDLMSMSASEAAMRHLHELAQLPSPKGWWQVATLPSGDPVGFVVPGRNHYNAVISYIAVLPPHRGNGFVDELLAEGVRVLSASDASRIRAATDVGNRPMAEAFARAGWINFERQITMTWT